MRKMTSVKVLKNRMRQLQGFDYESAVLGMFTRAVHSRQSGRWVCYQMTRRHGLLARTEGELRTIYLKTRQTLTKLVDEGCLRIDGAEYRLAVPENN